MPPITGKDEIRDQLTRYRDAIQFVLDETLKGMNEGKSVHTLMQQIKLPPELAIGEQYGRLTWSIRGIYEGLVGWFDENPVSMYEIPRSAVDSDLVELIGGPTRIIEKARQFHDSGQQIHALHLLEITLNADSHNLQALDLQIQAYNALLARTENVIEQGWLKYGIRQAEAKIEEAKHNEN